MRNTLPAIDIPVVKGPGNMPGKVSLAIAQSHCLFSVHERERLRFIAC
jgi:hypothetical protein